MRSYKLKGEDVPVYEDSSELPDGLVVQKDWRIGKKGEWVRFDDGCVMQILREGTMKSSKTDYFGTITGTYRRDADVITGERRGNIYSLGGKTWYESLSQRKELTIKERLFVINVISGMDIVSAYHRIYGGSLRNAKEKGSILLRQERVRVAIDREVKDAFEALGVDTQKLIKRMVAIMDSADNPRIELDALKELWKAKGIGAQEKTNTQVGVFHGFSVDAIEGAHRKEISSGE